jgi:hypothetical protein
MFWRRYNLIKELKQINHINGPVADTVTCLLLPQVICSSSFQLSETDISDVEIMYNVKIHNYEQ